jgi:hypothetical protein
MKIKDILFFALFLAALGATYVYYDGKVKGLKNEIHALSGRLKTTETELKNKSMNLSVYMAQHDKKDQMLDDLRAQVSKLQSALAGYRSDDGGSMKGQDLVAQLAGQNEQRVKQIMGEPATRLGPKSEWWYYHADHVLDEESGETYRSVQVLFENGIASKVTLNH